jgi:hypothetical protein
MQPQERFLFQHPPHHPTLRPIPPPSNLKIANSNRWKAVTIEGRDTWLTEFAQLPFPLSELLVR